MEKDICRRHLSREGIGCVWVFMNMFDFRHGGSNQQLLMDKKHGSKRIFGNNGSFEAKFEKQLTCDCEEREAGMQSVKKLIYEKTGEKCDFECRVRKRRSSTCSKTTEDIKVLIDGDDDHDERSDDQCPRISQNEVDLLNDDSVEKFSELIKRLIAQKDSKIESCKNQVLDSKDESFLNTSSPISGDSQRIKETSSSNERNISKCTQTIVILKPEPTSLDIGSSPGLDSTDYRTKSGRFGSRFLLSGIRRLRSVVGKNPGNTKHGSVQDQDSLSTNMTQHCCLGEDIQIDSGRNLSDGEMPDIANNEDTIHGSEDSKKSMSNIYIAARKHLSEMLAEGDTDVDLPDKEGPILLGKILALPEFSTPTSSPRVTLTHDFVGYSQLPVLDSDKHEKTVPTSDMPVSRGVSDPDKEVEEKTVLVSLCEAINSSKLQQDAYVSEDEHKKPLRKETFDERHSPNFSVRMSECQENTNDVPGKSSPVSVLEPLFTDDDLSPNSSRFSSVEMRMQPLCLRFDEPDSSIPDKDNDAKSRMDDKELTFAYIQAVVESSDLNWEELLARSFYSEKLLEQALMDDIDFCSTKLCSDKKLLFDCINEVLVELFEHGPWVSFIKPALHFSPGMETATEVIQEEVYWHLLPLPSPHTLDQIVRKDLTKNGIWMDLRFDISCIGSDTGEIILDGLLEEMINNYIDMVQTDSLSFSASTLPEK